VKKVSGLDFLGGVPTQLYIAPHIPPAAARVPPSPAMLRSVVGRHVRNRLRYAGPKPKTPTRDPYTLNPRT